TREESEVHQEACLFACIVCRPKAKVEGALHLRSLSDPSRDALRTCQSERMARVEFKCVQREREGRVAFALEKGEACPIKEPVDASARVTLDEKWCLVSSETRFEDAPLIRRRDELRDERAGGIALALGHQRASRVFERDRASLIKLGKRICRVEEVMGA